MMEYKKAKKLIKERGLSQKDLAESIGYTRQHLGDVLNGRSPAGKKLAKKLHDWSNGELSMTGLMRLN